MSELGAESARTRAAMLLVGVFLLGLVCGAALLYLGQRSVLRPARRPGGGGTPPMAQLVSELQLDPAQQKQIQAILDRNRLQLEGLLQNSREDVRNVLRPDQQQRFDRMPAPGAYRPR